MSRIPPGLAYSLAEISILWMFTDGCGTELNCTDFDRCCYEITAELCSKTVFLFCYNTSNSTIYFLPETQYKGMDRAHAHRPDAGRFSSEATNWNRFEAVNVCSCPRFDLVKMIGRVVHWSLTKTITTLMADSQNVLYYTVIMVGESRKFVSRRVLEYLITQDRNILLWSPNMPNLILM